MLEQTSTLNRFKYPVLVSMADYAGIMHSQVYLGACDRSSFERMVESARSGKTFLLDAGGRRYQVDDWVRIKPFGGLRGFMFWLEQSVFMEPVILFEQQLTPDEFKNAVRRVIERRNSFDTGSYFGVDVINGIKHASSIEEVVEALKLM